MNDIDLQRMQQAQLHLLDELSRICITNRIPFFLIGGSLIGVIRHKGFIPWDDDIDIGMIRENHDRFISAAKKDLGQRFFLQTPDTDKYYPNHYCSRLLLEGTRIVSQSGGNTKARSSISIDILPYDRIYKNRIIAFVYTYFFHVLLRVQQIKYGYKPNPKKRIFRFIMHFSKILFYFVPKKMLDYIIRNYWKIYAGNSNCYHLFAGSWGYPKETHLFEEISELTYGIFEDRSVPIPKYFDKFLTDQYGDYMKLPDLSERYNRHNVSFIDFGQY